MLNEEFNKDRTRYYGKRIGDLVKIYDSFRKKWEIAEVVEYGFSDNNRLKYKLLLNEDIVNWTAECSEIVIKVEDRKF